MILIGYTGPPGSGKDTACQIMKAVGEPEWSVERFSFADPLRSMADKLMGLTPGHQCWEPPAKDFPLPEFNGRTPREMLIDLGMLGRRYRPTVWVDLAVEAMTSSTADVGIVTDVRFKNEALKLLEMGGVLIELGREGCEYDPERESESGQAAPYATTRLANSGEMPAFQRDVERLWWTIVSAKRAMGEE